MYAVIGRFAFHTAPDAALRARIEEEIINPLSTQPGFQTLYFIRATETETTVVHLWASPAEAEQGLNLIAPRIKQLREEGLVSAVDRSMGEIIIRR